MVQFSRWPHGGRCVRGSWCTGRSLNGIWMFSLCLCGVGFPPTVKKKQDQDKWTVKLTCVKLKDRRPELSHQVILLHTHENSESILLFLLC